jgi:hypothetical protein
MVEFADCGRFMHAAASIHDVVFGVVGLAGNLLVNKVYGCTLHEC